MTDKESYGFVNTSEVLQAFGQAGWKPVSAQYGRVNKPEKQGFQKHLIKLENPQFGVIDGLNQNHTSVPQLVLLNSHDMSSRLVIFFGLLRIACLNGVIAGTVLNSMSLVHSRNIVDKLPEAIEYMVNNFHSFKNQVIELQSKQFTPAAAMEFIERVYRARLASVNNVTKIDLRVPNALRGADIGTDAFSVFNRVQEVLMRGGINYEYQRNTLNDDGKIIDTRLVSTTTRKISSVTQQIKLNQLVYDTALELAA